MPRGSYRRGKRGAYKKKGRRRFGMKKGNLQAPSSLSGKPILLSRSYNLPIPEKCIVKLHATEVIDIASGSAYQGSISIIANNVYQPFNVTSGNMVLSAGLTHGTGYVDADEPNTFVNYCGATALFTVYRVLSSAVRVKSIGLAGDGSQGLRVSCGPSIGSGTYANYRQASQGPYSKTMQVMLYQPHTLRQGLSMSKIFGVRPSTIMSDDDYSANYNAHPVNTCYWDIWYQTTDQAVTGSFTQLEVDMYWTIQLEYPNFTGTLD